MPPEPTQLRQLSSEKHIKHKANQAGCVHQHFHFSQSSCEEKTFCMHSKNTLMQDTLHERTNESSCFNTLHNRKLEYFHITAFYNKFNLWIHFMQQKFKNSWNVLVIHICKFLEHFEHEVHLFSLKNTPYVPNFYSTYIPKSRHKPLFLTSLPL